VRLSAALAGRGRLPHYRLDRDLTMYVADTKRLSHAGACAVLIGASNSATA
jgi:hypothetical protein